MSENEDDNPVLAALWGKVLNDWQDEARHRSFVAYCREASLLDVAAKHYREVVESAQEDDEARREDATSRLAALVTLAVATMARDRAEDPVAGPRHAVRIAALIVFALLMMSLAYAATLMSGEP